MKVRFSLYALIFCIRVSYSQNAPPIKLTTVFVDWDKKQFKNELPTGEDFQLKVYSNNSLPNDLILIRFLDTHPTFYYKSIPLTKIGATATAVKVNEPVKITRKQQIPTGGTTSGTIEETKEYSSDPDEIYNYVDTYLVQQVNSGFSYALIRIVDFEAGKSGRLKDKIISEKSSTPIVPRTNTEVEKVNEKFALPIIGIAYHPNQKFVAPYAGLRIAPFSPINRRVLMKHREMDAQHGSLVRHLKRIAFDIGITLTSLEDSLQHRKNLFGSSSLLLGVSYPLGATGTYLSTGTTLFNYQSLSTTPTDIHSTFYLSLSFNIELNPIFQSFGKFIGIK